jgi:hypothetical protein
VKYINKTKVNHLTSVLSQDYKIDTDWDGTRYLGLTLDWDYKLRKVHLSILGFIEKALIRFGHTPPDKPQLQPHPHTVSTYGATIQYAKHINQSSKATKEQQKYIQQVIGVLLYYGRAVDSTILVTLSSLASAQAAPTEYTMELIKWLLDYIATNPEAILTYKSSDMILAVHSDASYLSKANARSRVGGHFFCSTNVSDPPNNGAVLNISKIPKAIMSSAAKAELEALYINVNKAVPMHQILAEIGHKQPKTPIQTDNTTACGVVNHNIQPQRTKALDMRFHWLRCRLPSKQTTPLPVGLSTTTSNHNAPKHWTCISTGYVAVTSKDNYDTTGVLESRTEPTTGQNTTAPLTTLRRGQKS